MIRMQHLLRRNIYFIWPSLLGMMLIPILFYLIQFPRVPFSTYIILLYILLHCSFIFTIIFTIIAAALPIFYYFDEMWEAILAQIFMMIAGNIIFFVIVFSSIFDVPIDIILHIVDLQPTIVMALFSLTLLISSYF